MTVETLDKARAAFEAQAWQEAYAQLSAVDQTSGLAPDDLERLAAAAFLTGREENSTDLWARAHQAFLKGGETERAVGCAYWLAFGLVNQGDFARAGGWIGRAAKLLGEDRDCVQRGYLLMLNGIQALWQGDLETASTAVNEAKDIATRFGDFDLATLSGLGLGQIAITRGNVAEGVGWLDEVMVAVTSGEVSATVSGLAYCAVISACQEVFDLRRAQEWSSALAHWCDDQPDLVPYSGWCLVHRGEIMQIHGAWADAADSAKRAYQRSLLSTDQATGGAAHCLLADVHRLQGEFTLAEGGYREASRLGHEPQPGLALLRLAQGQADSAASTIRRVVEETQERTGRAKVLAACVEIMLAVGDLPSAEAASDELSEIASTFGAPLLRAVSAMCVGRSLLASHDARAALPELRRAWTTWRELDVPYEAALTRELIGLACRALGDEDSAQMELDAACWAFRELGAAPDLARVESLAGMTDGPDTCGLTARELEVLRLVASGKTNRTIANDLFLSEKTVARHLSNIFTKLSLSSRAAATAFAYEHQLI